MSVLSPPPEISDERIRPFGYSSSSDARRLGEASLTARALRPVLFHKLRKIQGGQIHFLDGDFYEHFGDPESELSVRVRVEHPRFYRAVAFGGSMGAGESYCDGDWTCDDLTSLIRIFARNMQASSDLGGFSSAILDIGRQLAHGVRRNTRAGSRRNIAAHYDLSNEFYSLFLDETMTYSSGVFHHAEATMQEASVEKYDRICRKLRLTPSDHVLEIGTGWGGFAEHAASRYGCRVTTTTISGQQYEFARKRFEERGLMDRVSLLQSDYRDLQGQFDKLVSIEMIEAVGHQYFDTYFETCSRLLKPDGLFALQAITIPDQRYDKYIRSVDFIQKYVFPGGCLPSLGAMTRSVGKRTDLQFVHLEDFAEHYARTLRSWHDKFVENLGVIRKLGMPPQFLRLWEYYLCYCEGAFLEKQIGVAQILLQKPLYRQAPCYPALG